LCEAIRSDPLESPLVVWFNGGPGASSFIGFLLENGPYILDANTDTLRYNDFSWNQVNANVLYLESPSGSGFSHSDHQILDDNMTAELNMKVLEEFKTRLTPH
ncbi:hypothetical protein PENTCL1PPCAC_5165, partial [Pristionchus entomophagus]